MKKAFLSLLTMVAASVAAQAQTSTCSATQADPVPVLSQETEFSSAYARARVAQAEAELAVAEAELAAVRAELAAAELEIVTMRATATTARLVSHGGACSSEANTVSLSASSSCSSSVEPVAASSSSTSTAHVADNVVEESFSESPPAPQASASGAAPVAIAP
jgi:hypothetical protein